MTLECRLLVNAAGLGAPAVARSIDGMPIDLIPPAYLAKGNYFSCSARAPFSRLIYPVPEPGGLGVHLTLDMAGQARFGPDVEWVDAIDYAVDPARAERFYPAIRRYWPTLPDGALMPSYSGIRPKIVPPAVAVAGFPDPGAARPWRRRADQSVRDRVAGADVIAGDRGPCRRTGRGMSSAAQLRRCRANATAPEDNSGVSAIALIPGRWWDIPRLQRRASAAFRPRYASTARSASLTINFRRFSSTICRSSVERCTRASCNSFSRTLCFRSSSTRCA